MPEKPTIIVQLIHIEGPLKGEIEEFVDEILQIGRHPDCQVRFPKDITIVSRNHADIIRDGNRFKVVDHSTNGTFLNGKNVKEAVLKNGDVLMIGDGGPKVSFLAEIKSGPTEVSSPAPKPQAAPEAGFDHPPPAQPASPLANQSLSPKAYREHPPSNVPVSKPSVDIADDRVQAPLTIQFGPTIQSYKMLPVIIGKKRDCDFIIDHAHIVDRHLKIFFFESNYWIKDLTGQGLITINGTPVREKTPLHPDSQLSLGPQGPVFQFLSGGRLAEVSDLPQQATGRESKPAPENPRQTPTTAEPKKQNTWLILIILFMALLAGGIWIVFNSDTTIGRLSGWWHRLLQAIQRITG